MDTPREGSDEIQYDEAMIHDMDEEMEIHRPAELDEKRSIKLVHSSFKKGFFLQKCGFNVVSIWKCRFV
jgi:hypothetical protein